MRLPILDKLEKILMDSKKELEVDIPKALKIATDMGDLSENAEWKFAIEERDRLGARAERVRGVWVRQIELVHRASNP